jgi:hypothetical protein
MAIVHECRKTALASKEPSIDLDDFVDLSYRIRSEITRAFDTPHSNI